jgi:uncharacterized glyoxalase superfamily protein PhnB
MAALNAKVMTGLTANDVHKTLKFYVDGLGFEVGEKHETEGKLVYVTIKAGDAEIGISQDDFAKGRDRAKGIGMRLYIGTKQDVPAIAARAKAAGFKLDSEPAPLPWGPMGFAVTDPDGFKLTVANEA